MLFSFSLKIRFWRVIEARSGSKELKKELYFHTMSNSAFAVFAKGRRWLGQRKIKGTYAGGPKAVSRQ